MKKTFVIAALTLIASIANANARPWLICETPGEAPNIDFTIIAQNPSAGGTVLMTVTQMSGDSEVYEGQIGPKTLVLAQKTNSISSLVLTSEHSEIKGETFISRGAIVSINNGMAKVAMSGSVYKNLNCK